MLGLGNPRSGRGGDVSLDDAPGGGANPQRGRTRIESEAPWDDRRQR
jgi:hypothetical protein